ncbi:GATA zinc finger domain-containing protein 14-like [Argopecten irradians]|uniref:GATA zinc finger domain-containing protein 14-like n=1 Tax=Argopecten irradians TaxID=31199 RepID=UPI003719362E
MSFLTFISGLVLLRNKRNVKSRAELRSCARHNCSNTACGIEDGWHLYGSDWGCCGNYDGCCTWASVICYAHDVVCQCCDYGWWCGPDCKREPECFRPGRKIPDRFGGLDHSVVNQIPQNGSGYARSMGRQKERNNTRHSNRIPSKIVPSKFNSGIHSENSHERNIRTKGENISETVEELVESEHEDIQNISQEFNSNFSRDQPENNSSVARTDEYAKRNDAYANRTNEYVDINDEYANRTDEYADAENNTENFIHNTTGNSSGTMENIDEKNQIQNSNFSTAFEEFNVTAIPGDQDGGNHSDVVGSEGDFIQVSRTSSDNTEQDNLEEDGSGML